VEGQDERSEGEVSMSDVAIQTDKLTRDFNGLRAVDELTLRVPAGSVFGFLGPNGAGKTTTLRLLLGLLEPSGGSAEVLGHDIRSEADRIRECSGALLEHSGLYERLTAEDNLEFYGRVFRLDSIERRQRSQELLTSLGLWERRREAIGGWSRGMKQKLAVARSLLHRPSLVFLDEPTAGLDPLAASALRTELADLAQREGVTVFLTTHNLAEAESLCDQVAVIRRGRLLAVGAPAELRAQASNSELVVRGRGFHPGLIRGLEARPEVTGVTHIDGQLRISLRQARGTADLVRWIVAQGPEVEEVRKEFATLEEVFFKLVEEDGT
jgi:ABC-2 type transport system ATP-binding protein